MRTRKNPSQKEIKTIEQEANRVREEYDYMDEMPIEGWMWEFIRRTEEYKEVSKLFEQNIGFRFDEQNNAFIKNSNGVVEIEVDIRNIPITPTIACQGCEGCYVVKERKRSPVGLNLNQFIITSYSKFFLENGQSTIYCADHGYPRAEIKYSEFYKDQKPSIEGLNSVIHLSAKELLRRGLDNAEHIEWTIGAITEEHFRRNFNIPETSKSEIDSPRDVSNFKYPSNLKSGLYCALVHELQFIQRLLLREIAPNTLEDTIFIGISKTGKPGEILEQVKTIIEKQVKQRENRFSRAWKQQIISYDLKEQRNLTFKEIANIINKAYKKNYSYIDLRNDVYSNAVYMIDKGGYREHLNRYDKNVDRRYIRKLLKT